MGYEMSTLFISLWTEKKVSEYLGLSVRTLRRYRTVGGGPKYFKGPGLKGAVRYRPSDVQDWANSRMATSTSFALNYL
jgi:DNA-binding transcriptional MerR regulator